MPAKRKHTLTVGATQIPYDVRYSDRAKRLQMVATPKGIEVVAPQGTPLDGKRGITTFAHERRRWAYTTLKALQAKEKKQLTQFYASGAKLQYRGRWLTLNVTAADVPRTQVECRSRFHITVPEVFTPLERLASTRTALNLWLRARAKKDLEQMGRKYETALGVSGAGFKLSDSKARWGSCGKDGVIRVHWQLVKAPKAAFEYVVGHEVAHLVERNHSSAFWKLLATAMPDWAERKRMLERWEGEHRVV